MRQETLSEFMDRWYKELARLRSAGQKEYAGEGQDAFANFNRLADDLDIDRKMVLWVYARKHMDGIVNYLKGHRSQREGVEGRISDLIVYLFLLLAMIEEDEGRPLTLKGLQPPQTGAGQMNARSLGPDPTQTTITP